MPLVLTASRDYSPDMAGLLADVFAVGIEGMQMRCMPHQISASVTKELRAAGFAGERLFTEVRNVLSVSMY